MKSRTLALISTIVLILVAGAFYYMGTLTGTNRTIQAYRDGYIQIDNQGHIVLRTDTKDPADLQGREYPDIKVTGNKVLFVPVAPRVKPPPVSLEDTDEVQIPTRMTPAMRSVVLPRLGQVDVSVIKFDALPPYVGTSTSNLFDACKEKFGWKALSSLDEANLLPRHLLHYSAGQGVYFFYNRGGDSSQIAIGEMTPTGSVKEVPSQMIGGKSITQMVQDGVWVKVSDPGR